MVRRIVMPLRVLLPCLAVCLAASSAAAIGVAGVSAAGGSVTRQADDALVTVCREGPAPGTWRYNLNDGTDNRAATGRVARMTGHMDMLRYAVGIGAAGYEP